MGSDANRPCESTAIPMHCFPPHGLQSTMTMTSAAAGSLARLVLKTTREAGTDFSTAAQKRSSRSAAGGTGRGWPARVAAGKHFAKARRWLISHRQRDAIWQQSDELQGEWSVEDKEWLQKEIEGEGAQQTSQAEHRSALDRPYLQ